MECTNRKPHALKDDDQHRLQCPRGHCGWKPIDSAFWCPECERHWDDVDGAFDEVYDAKTGDRLDRTAVRELEEEIKRQQTAGD